MNKEIEEILYVLKHIVIGRATRLTCREADKLLSYIEQLEKEIEDYQKELEKADSITQSCIFEGERSAGKSYRECLNMLEKLNRKNKQLENNRDKAIEYIEKYKYYAHSINVYDLLNILKGDIDYE